ncbi:MAG: hypothetical protein AB7F74_15905 [Parvibaculaceae bacterium]
MTFEKFDDELIVIHLARGTYSSLTGSAPAIFDVLAEARSAGDIARLFGFDPDKSPERVSEIAAFLDLLADNGFVASVAEGPSSPPLPGPLAWSAPAIQIFHDLSDLMMLDPIHEVDAEAGWPTKPQ